LRRETVTKKLVEIETDRETLRVEDGQQSVSRGGVLRVRTPEGELVYPPHAWSSIRPVPPTREGVPIEVLDLMVKDIRVGDWIVKIDGSDWTSNSRVEGTDYLRSNSSSDYVTLKVQGEGYTKRAMSSARVHRPLAEPGPPPTSEEPLLIWSPQVITDDLVTVFKENWDQADMDGHQGSRTKIALQAVLDALIAESLA
jgi:hypothetical protein